MADKVNRQEDGQRFPLRVAATDIGSNAIRFLAAEFADATQFRILDQLRVPVRLGHDVFSTGDLTEPAIDAALDALASFARRLHELGITLHRAVATSAVRESHNGRQLVDRALNEAGLVVQPISGAEEARLVHLAVVSRVRLGRQRWLIADLGGGSLEVSIVDEERIYTTETHELGSVRLLEELSIAGEEPAAFHRRVERYTEALRASDVLQLDTSGFIATGGNIESIARLAGADANEAGVATVTLSELRAVIGRLVGLSCEERVTKLGLREDRADVILPAATVYERVAVIAGAETIVVPNVGVKDGVALDLVQQRTGRLTLTSLDRIVTKG